MNKYLFFFSVLLVAASGCKNTNTDSMPINPTENAKNASNPANSAIPANPATMLPPFKMVDMKGKVVNLADLKGKKVFVNLWATWCPPCRAEIPSIENLYSKIDKNNAVFVMLSLDDAYATAVNFASVNRLTTPVYYPAENLPALFNVPGIPATFIFDEAGNLISSIEGTDQYDTPKYLAIFNK